MFKDENLCPQCQNLYKRGGCKINEKEMEVTRCHLFVPIGFITDGNSIVSVVTDSLERLGWNHGETVK